MTILHHQIRAISSPKQVWHTLTTRAGLTSWWPGTVTIHGGDSWRFASDDNREFYVMRVVEDIPDRALEWLCIQGPEHWQNTLIHWRLESNGPEQLLSLEHRDLRQDVALLGETNTHWGVLLERLRVQLQTEINPLDDRDLTVWT